MTTRPALSPWRGPACCPTRLTARGSRRPGGCSVALRLLTAMVLIAVAFPLSAAAHNGAVAVAVPLRGITVDGDLSDWPADLRSYPIALTEYGVSPKGPEDYQGSFRVGFDPEAAVLLVAIEMRDNSHVVDRTLSRSWDTEDGCELYLDPVHGERSVAAQHSLRGVPAPGQAQAATGPSARVGWSATKGIVRYEWAVQLEGLSPDSLRLPRTVGLDVVLGDRDEDGSFSWMAWGPGVDKTGLPESRGDLVLVPDAGSLGLLHGEAVWADGKTAMAGRLAHVQAAAYPRLWVRQRADGSGTFELDLPEGGYRADLELGRRGEQVPITEVSRGKTTRITLTAQPGRGRTVPAGPGITVKAGGYRQGSWQIIGAQDGLLSGRVISLLQDRQGFLWIGTSAGLCRFDGLSFLNRTAADSLVDPSVTALAEDRSGNLWIGTRAGLNRFDGRSFTHFGVEDGLIDPNVTALLVDRSGILWVGTTGGLCRLEGQDIVCYSTAQGLIRNQVTSLAEDTAGGLWVACGGLCRFDGQGAFLPAGPFAPDEVEVLTIAAGRTGGIWMGTYQGLARYDGSRWSTVPTTGAPQAREIGTLLEDRDGVLWVGASSGGLRPNRALYRYDGQTWSRGEEALADHQVLALLEDREGNVWAGTSSAVARHDAGEFVRYDSTTGLAGNIVRSLLEDHQGRVWAATDKGLSWYDGKRFTVLTAEGLSPFYAEALAEDHLGRLWISTYGSGLFRLELAALGGRTPPRLTVVGPSQGLTEARLGSLHLDQRGNLWISTNGGGLIRYDGQRFTAFTTADGLPSNSIGVVTDGPDSAVWVSTWQSGISMLRDRVWLNLSRENGLPGNMAGTAFRDAAGRLWVGLQPGGLCRYDEGGLTCFTTRDGLVDDTVTDVAADDRGVLWIATAGGVSQYDGRVFQSLWRRDGLPRVGLVLPDRHGQVWFGSSDGVFRYRPRQVPPPVTVTDVISDRHHGPVTQLSLPAGQPRVAFHFRGISFRTAPGALLYRYRLAGRDDDWRVTTYETVEYADLPRGRYTFEVVAIDRDLSYSIAPARVELELHWPYTRIALWCSLSLTGVLGCLMVVAILRHGREAERARQAAEAASRSKSSFLANMSHEIRTPMNAVVGMVELLLDSETDPTRRSYLRTIDASAEALLGILNDILDLSKIEAGRLGLERTPFSLWQTLDGVMKTMALRAHEKGLELACHIAPEVPEELEGDPARLRQLLVNLVGNAIKFTEQGEVVVQLALAEPVIDGAVQLHGSVRDTGIGIPPEHQQAIFAAFTQADASTTRRFGGTGLGLAICTQLVQLMEGRLWVESKPGQGSTFHFTIRLALATGPVTEPRPAGELRGVRLLVVDDNATNRRILEETARRWPAEVTSVESGPKALEELARAAVAGAPYGLVLLDLMMPGMDGLAVAAQIGQRPELGSPAMLLLSSADDPADARRAEELGMRQVLRKPVTRPELEQAVAAAMEAGSRRETPVPIKTPAPTAEPGLRILLAEDNLVNQTVAVRMLSGAGHQVTVAANGVQALERLTAETFDLVLMDVQMPEMGGLEATRRLREEERRRGGHLPVVGLSASVLREDREACLANGMDDFVAKPVRRQELLDAIERWRGSKVAPDPQLPNEGKSN